MWPTPSDHLDMMASPDRWPCILVLPLKRYRDGDLEVGYLYQPCPHTPCPPPDPVVYLANIYAGPPTDKTPRIDYPDLVHVVSDGWEVD